MSTVSPHANNGNPRKSLKPKQRQFVCLLAQGLSQGNATKQIGINEKTGYRWLRLPHIQAELEQETKRVLNTTSPLQKDEDSYVYTIAYPDGTVFYVGKGTGERIKQHLVQAAGNPKSVTEVVAVIRSIWQRGEKVRIRKPYTNLSDSEALRLEKELIERYGYDQLVNHPSTLEGRMRQMAKNDRKWQSFT